MLEMNLQFFGGRGGSSGKAGNSVENNRLDIGLSESDFSRLTEIDFNSWKSSAFKGTDLGQLTDDYTGYNAAKLTELHAFNLNKAIREKNMSEKQTQYMKKLDENMRPLSKNVQLTRYISTQEAEALFGLRTGSDAVKSKNKAMKEVQGKLFENKGYMSTSYDPRRNVSWKGLSNPGGPGSYKVVVNTPKGVKALATGSKAESEIIVHREAKYRVDKITTKYDYKKKTYGEIHITIVN